MAEPILQPALLDRLADDARTLTLVTVTVDTAGMAALSASLNDIESAFRRQGFELRESERSPSSVSTGAVRLQFSGVGVFAQPAQILEFAMTPSGAVRKIRLRECCSVEVESIVNAEVTAAERQGLSMKKLRVLVRRDLSNLLNTVSIDSAEDMSGHPRVSRSVINYGMPSLAGLLASKVDPLDVADSIRRAIECFEPRLSRIAVTPEDPAGAAADGSLAFRIEAELWGQPFPEALTLRTRIDVGSGAVEVEDAGRGLG